MKLTTPEQEILEILSHNGQAMSTTQISQQLKDDGIYSTEKSQTWTNALERLCNKDLVIKQDAPDLGLVRKRYQIAELGKKTVQGVNPMAKISTEGKTVSDNQTPTTTTKTTAPLSTPKPKVTQAQKAAVETLNKPTDKVDPLQGFTPIEQLLPKPKGISIHLAKDDSVRINIKQETAAQLNFKAGEKVRVLINQQTKQIALHKTNNNGYTLQGKANLSICIGKTLAGEIAALMKQETIHTTDLEQHQNLVKAKVA